MMIEVRRKTKRIVLVSLGSNNTATKKLKWNEINSYEDACSVLGIDPDEELRYQTKPHIIAQLKLETITLAINEGEVLDWSNTNQKKWYPWFKVNMHKPEATENGVSSVGRFSVGVCFYFCVNSGVGSRVCFVTEEKARYAGQKFIELYEQIL